MLYLGNWILDVLAVDHNLKITSALFEEFAPHIGSRLGLQQDSRHPKAKAKRVHGVTLLGALSQGPQGLVAAWDWLLPNAIFAINNTASTLDCKLTFFIQVERAATPAPAAVPP